VSRIARPGEILLDHIGLFVSDLDRAGAALAQLGFAVTEVGRHMNPPSPGEPPQPSGTANRRIMLGEGYIEILAALGHTPTGTRLRARIEGYGEGVHLLAFGSADAGREHARLGAAGFSPQPLVQLSREVATEDGPRTARFTVARVPAEAMSEGRMQFVTHHTPELVWRPRDMRHANGACKLSEILIATADPGQSAARFSRFLGRPAPPHPEGAEIVLDRGRLLFVPRAAGASGPEIAAFAVEVAAIDAVDAVLTKRNIRPERAGPGWIALSPAQCCGARLVLHEARVTRPFDRVLMAR
jgi:Glyoxalase-like domain